MRRLEKRPKLLYANDCEWQESRLELMGFESKIPKGNREIREESLEGLASAEAGLLNERERLLLLFGKAWNSPD